MYKIIIFTFPCTSLYYLLCESVGFHILYKTPIIDAGLLQKQVIHDIKQVSYYEHTNPLFIKCGIMKVYDLVHYTIMQIVFRGKLSLLPGGGGMKTIYKI